MSRNGDEDLDLIAAGFLAVTALAGFLFIGLGPFVATEHPAALLWTFFVAFMLGWSGNRLQRTRPNASSYAAEAQTKEWDL